MIPRWIRDAPLRQKLTGLTLVVSGVSLFAALIAFFVFQVRVGRELAARDLVALAEVVAANAAGPIAFSDREAAQATLATLRARPDIVRARLANPEGKTIAEFPADESGEEFAAPATGERHRIDGIRIFVAQPVSFNQEALGWLELTADFQPTLARLTRAAAGVVVVILAAALLLAYMLIRRWQRVLTEPLSALANTAQRIAAAKDYSLRATKHGADEIGRLTDDFNVMLGEIQTRDVALSGAKQAASEQVIALQREVAERQRTEAELHVAKNAAESANRAKSSFLAAMSHEIRTPMNGVLGMSNLLLDTSLSREQQDFVRVIRQSGETLLNLLNDILDFSKIEAGRIDLEATDFDLRDLIEDTMELQLVSASAKKLDLCVDVDPALPTAVRGDPHRLRQVLTNLLANAVKFTAAGKVTVRAHVAKEEGGRSVYRLEVRDTGVGLEPAMQARLFQPFVQADTSTTRRFGGTGLGLAISKRLVELMGGTIGVESTPGHGATFWFVVPLAKQPSATAAAAAPRNLGHACVLLAATDAENRARLERQLRAWELVPVLVSDAESARRTSRNAAAAGQSIPLAIVDLALAESETLELTRQLTAAASNSVRGGAAILLSTIESRIAASACQANGIAVCLTKPVRTRALYQAIADALAQVAESGSTRVEPRAATGATAAGPAIEAETSFDGIRVLLVEDHLVNQRIARLVLERMGCTVQLALNGREAISQLVAGPYDLVLMDCQMPEMDGFEATRLIRANEDSGIWRDRPRAFIVAMTANAMQGDRENCLAVGMDDYIAKPFKREALERVLQRVRMPAATK